MDPAHMLSMEQPHKHIILFCANGPQTQQLAQLLGQYWPHATILMITDVEALMAAVARQTPDMIIVPGVEKQDRYFISCIKMLRNKMEIDSIPVYVYNAMPAGKDLDILWRKTNAKS
jgi:UDP-N-acetyl-D-mannosaminuronic acid transferase (WecB/TagA/CpsF family)